jgi:hypothetical protein
MLDRHCRRKWKYEMRQKIGSETKREKVPKVQSYRESTEAVMLRIANTAVVILSSFFVVSALVILA